MNTVATNVVGYDMPKRARCTNVGSVTRRSRADVGSAFLGIDSVQRPIDSQRPLGVRCAALVWQSQNGYPMLVIQRIPNGMLFGSVTFPAGYIILHAPVAWMRMLTAAQRSGGVVSKKIAFQKRWPFAATDGLCSPESGNQIKAALGNYRLLDAHDSKSGE